MKLCGTCKKNKCNKRLIIEEQENLKVIKCLEYEKDENKVKGYIKPKQRTARLQRTVMGLYSPSWN